MTDSIRKAQNIHAFPSANTPSANGAGGWPTNAGMELRDYFAAHAITLFPVTVYNGSEETRREMAKRAALAFQFADAMLEAR